MQKIDAGGNQRGMRNKTMIWSAGPYRSYGLIEMYAEESNFKHVLIKTRITASLTSITVSLKEKLSGVFIRWNDHTHRAGCDDLYLKCLLPSTKKQQVGKLVVSEVL